MAPRYHCLRRRQQRVFAKNHSQELTGLELYLLQRWNLALIPRPRDDYYLQV